MLPKSCEAMMDTKSKVKSNLQEAELYKTQGLLNEALEKYLRAGNLIRKDEQLARNKKLYNTVIQKIRALKAEIERIDSSPDTKEVSESVQNIIKEKFAYGEEGDARALEGAIALAKFGQYERALREFRDLMQQENVKVDSAKNIIRCHVTLDSIDDAIRQYEEWFRSNAFTPEQINRLRVFLQSILDKKGIDKTLPHKEVEAMPAESPAALYDNQEVMDGEIIEPEYVEGEVMEDEIQDEDIIDISSVEITLEEGPQKGQTVEYDVSFQSGRVINLLVSSSDKELIETLKTGLELRKVHFYSPMAMFNGEGVVFSKSKIESGPKQGDYSLDIEIKSIK